MTQKLKFSLGRVENVVGKGENAGYQHFLLFPQCFQKDTFSRAFKSGLCGKELINFINFLVVDWKVADGDVTTFNPGAVRDHGLRAD